MKKVFLLIVCFLLIGCSSNKEMEPISTEDFESAFTNNSFTVVDNKNYYQSIQYITDAYIASIDEDTTVEYITYDSVDNAENLVKDHIRRFNMLKSTGASETNETGKNYHKYVLISNNYYMTSSRIDTTVIFCKTKIENKNAVEKALKELGL